VFAAFLASLCCIGPLVFVTLGVGAGLASTFEPLRPIFGVVTAMLLAVGFYVVYRPRRDAGDATCAPGETCATSRPRRDRLFVWAAALLSLALWTFPSWSTLFA
jgi:mercuric ion transport protein